MSQNPASNRPKNGIGQNPLFKRSSLLIFKLVELNALRYEHVVLDLDSRESWKIQVWPTLARGLGLVVLAGEGVRLHARRTIVLLVFNPVPGTRLSYFLGPENVRICDSRHEFFLELGK